MKNKILIFFGLGTLLFITMTLDSFHNYFGPYINKSFLSNFIRPMLGILVFSPLVLFFSIITYMAPDKVFISWWKFARYGILFILILSIPVSLGFFHTLGGFFNLDDLVDIFLYALIGLFFAIGSIIQIVRGYRQK